MESNLRFFFRQCAYALAFFSFVAILAEWLVPGSVAPFLDPIPVAIISMMLLAFDAMVQSGRNT